jgi:sugar O-acyltransferase (sialic acid O-acetyltransferase NeuD family)
MNHETSRPKLLLWGAGAHGRVIHDLAGACGYREVAFVDDCPAAELVCGSPVLRPDDERMRGYTHFIVALGDNRVRARCFEAALRRGLEAAVLIHPSAVISVSAVIGFGTMVLPLVVVGGGVSIGENCILNTACVVEHDSKVCDHVHISPGVIIGGEVTVETLAHAGMGARVLSRLRVGREAILGAGAVVTKDVDTAWVVAGVPAKPLREVARV